VLKGAILHKCMNTNISLDGHAEWAMVLKNPSLRQEETVQKGRTSVKVACFGLS
jgi:hypothetical protein